MKISDQKKSSRFYDAVEGEDVRSLRYRPELTTVRFPLALLVLVAHNDVNWRFGFWIALNGWLAISGYLITLAMLTEFDKTGKVSMKKFYARRALRLLPALYVACIAVLIYGLVTHQGDYVYSYLYSTLAAVFYFEDIWAITSLGHGFPVFGQLWTLSVEEQFYFLWAPLVILFIHKLDKEKLLKFTVLATIAICIYRVIIYFVTHDPQRIYYAFDTRLDSILVGCVVALLASTGRLSSKIPNWYRNSAPYLAWIGFIGTILMMIFVKWLTAFASTAAIPLSDLFILFMMPYLILTPNSKRAKFLSYRPFVHLGNLTYPMYIWNWIVVLQVNVLNTHLGPWPLYFLRLAVIMVLAETTYWFFEVPLHKLRKYRFTTKEMRGLTAQAA
ncbi:MAG: acyltransferase [Acidimicrobiales bacterium]|nr:acyltransferase [Acidimicrobiales bacterium]